MTEAQIKEQVTLELIAVIEQLSAREVVAQLKPLNARFDSRLSTLAEGEARRVKKLEQLERFHRGEPLGDGLIRVEEFMIGRSRVVSRPRESPRGFLGFGKKTITQRT